MSTGYKKGRTLFCWVEGGGAKNGVFLAFYGLALSGCELPGIDILSNTAELAPAGASANIISNTIPTNMAPGEKVNAQVVVQNDGTVDWSSTSEWGLRADNLDFGILNDFIDTATPQGASSTHHIVLTAPVSSATFSVNFYSFIRGQSGAVTPTPLSVPITVSGATTPQYACSFVRSTLPATMVAGAVEQATVTVQNSGAATWTSGNFCLYARENADSTNPSLLRWGRSICLPTGSSVAPGQEATFSIPLAAPVAPGTYRFMRQMSDNRGRNNGGVGFFSSTAFCVDESITVSAGTLPLAASAVTHTVPTQAAPGDTVPVTISMRNDGSNTWTTGSNITFESTTSPVNFWGPTRATLSGDVAPGQVATFSFRIRIPNAPTGTQSFSFRMFQKGVGFFGDEFTTNVDISTMVTASLDSSFTSNDLPTLIAPSATQTVSITVENTGTEAWAADGTYGLVSTTSPPNKWGRPVRILGTAVAVGGSTTFNFNITSPSMLGTDTFRYRMWRSGWGLFGGELVVNTTISDTAVAPYNAEVVSQTIPAVATAGSVEDFSITMRNSGAETWPADSTINLTSSNTPFNLWGPTTRIVVPTETAPGATATFTFKAIMPSTPNIYTSRWRMLRQGAGYFGAVAETMDVSITVMDVDECATQTDDCDVNATCTNTPGSFTCACNSGYSGDGKTCSDIDECTAGTHTCDANATCSNTPGSFTCACNSGFNGDGASCADINECVAGTHTCSVNAACTNTPGSFTCSCNSGYSGDGTVCSDIDECTLQTDNCDANATCDNNAGGFLCTCNPGFTGNGVVCSSSDPCTDGTHSCDVNATCSPTFGGGHSCTCGTGYTGNGTSCTPNYDIVLAFVQTPSADELAAFQKAEARWENLITADTTNINLTGNASAISACGIPAGFENIDDIVIQVNLQPIDGVGGVLGSAGPRCTIGGLPISGVMTFDTADNANMIAQGTFEAVILHEIGHVLGIGSLWSSAGLLVSQSCAGGGAGNGADTRFVGTNATAEWRTLGGTGDLPVENTLGAGSCDSHWRENSVLREELMSPQLSTINALSSITLRSLADLGFSVAPNSRADSFTIGSPLLAPGDFTVVDMVDDIDHGPLFDVSETGMVTRIR